MPELAVPIERLSFTAYRLGAADGRPPQPATLFLGLNQWFAAEKFRGVEEELFQAALMQPTVKEARRFEQMHKTRWRFDWLKVRTRALACGMLYACRCDVGHKARWDGSVSEIARLLEPLGLPPSFIAAAAQEFVALRHSPRIAFLGAEAAPRAQVGRRLNALHRKHAGCWTLVQWQGRHTSWDVHNWALQQGVPPTYAGQDGDRLTNSALAQLATSCSLIVVFEQKGGKTMDRILRTLRSQKKASVELELFEPEGQTLTG